MSDAEKIQKAYYKNTASAYDAAHVHGSGEHDYALDWVISIGKSNQIQRILDVGCGTGRAFFKLKENGFQAMGVEPSEDLRCQALKKGASDNEILLAEGGHLPFTNGEFDAVCEFGVLHHVENPSAVVKEMMRVASKVIFISDSNRFGQGSVLIRWIKLILYKLGLWPLFTWIRTWGKKYMISEGDGLFYSYSIYDSLKTLEPWAKKIILIPTQNEDVKSWLRPLLTSPHILLVAFKK